MAIPNSIAKHHSSNLATKKLTLRASNCQKLRPIFVLAINSNYVLNMLHRHPRKESLQGKCLIPESAAVKYISEQGPWPGLEAERGKLD